jgi:ankyrin repeat protein
LMSQSLPYFKDIVNDSNNTHGWSPLLYSASVSTKSDLQVLKLLIENGAHILKPSENDGMTALHIAAGSNDIHLLDFLLTELGEDAKRHVNLGNNEGWTPMHMACFLNNFDTVNLLLEYGGEMDKANGVSMTSLHELVRSDNKDLLECVWDHAKAFKRDVK